MKIRCEVCGEGHYKKEMVNIVVDGIAHRICKNCVCDAEVLHIMKPEKEEIELVGSFELGKNGTVSCDIPDFGFAKAYEEEIY